MPPYYCCCFFCWLDYLLYTILSLSIIEYQSKVCFAVSNIKRNKLDEHEFLQMTLLIDHDVVDGMPVAHFIRDLKRLIELK
ncbi:MAG: 2-oxo acid dehydrogenase subunit E2 [Thermotogota bacterium]